jgi:hypothetical protein
VLVELLEKVVPVIVRLPPVCKRPPPPRVPTPVAELPEITQFVTDTVLLMEPEMIPPPPTAVVSVPPVMVTPEIAKSKSESRSGFTSITRLPADVCWIIVVAAPAPVMMVLSALISRSPIALLPVKP